MTVGCASTTFTETATGSLVGGRMTRVLRRRSQRHADPGPGRCDRQRLFFRLDLGLSFVFTRGRSGFIPYDRTIGRTGITQDNLSIGFRMEF